MSILVSRYHSAIKSNLPLEKIFRFREIGYIEDTLDQLIKQLDLSEVELWLIFRLANQNYEITISESKKKQIVFIVADESDVIPENVLETSYAVFRQYLPDEVRYSKVFHLPVGPSRVSEHLPYKAIEDRKYNVFFSGNLHLGRKELYDNFTKLRFLPFSIKHRIQGIRKASYDDYYSKSYIRFNKGFHTGLRPGDYAKALYDAKITLCPYGLSSRETMRHFEAMRAGTIIVTKPMPNHFCYQEAPFVTIDKWSDLDEKIDVLLSNEKLLKEYHERTLSWWNNWCSPKAVANYIVTRLNTISG